MKKLTTLIALLLITLSLTACNTEEEPFTLTNFTIISTTTVFNDKTQYDSVFNLDATNTSLFSSLKETIGEHEVVMIDDLSDLTKDDNQVFINIITNNGSLEIYTTTYEVDGESILVTIVEFNDEDAAYASIDMYNELKALYE